MSMENRSMESWVLALAGVSQFAQYAHGLASGGPHNDQHLDSALQVIFCTDPKTTPEVFGGVGGCADGIRFLQQQLDGTATGHDNPALVSRYSGQLLRLGSRLRKRPESLHMIVGAIERAKLGDPADAPELIDAAYRDTISKMKPRIMVRGQASNLNNPLVTQWVRTYLMAGVRCAVLWRQNGGTFWKIFLQRAGVNAALTQLSIES